ncbi:MAG: glycerophosphodiester phosphodiesterase [Chloroflexi bacterium]|nr:glycerophosphodiester phosphodiesterase [Chloroflexota bacterium]MDA1004534.1 glycerophosphodiester phosphodiesterase [Chloroflexota bacterium]
MPVTRILHRGGNLRSSFGSADHPAVDALEADVWVHGGALYLHHERTLGPLPIMLRGARPVRRPGDLTLLNELLEAVSDRADLVLDLRSWFGDPAPDLARVLMTTQHRDRISVTCEAWPIADRLRAWAPETPVAYSVRSARQLRVFAREHADGTRARTAVAIRHTLLASADDVARLRDAAGRVTAWTVDDIDRALELAAWGVDAIVSNRLTVLNAL